MSGETSYDVIVVGSGGGALTAAYLAQKAGLSTAVVEKTQLVGGTSAYSGGACWLPGTQVQERSGVADSTQAAREYLLATLVEPELAKVEAFVTHAPQLVQQLEADPYIEFEHIPFPEYFDAPGRVSNGRSIQPVNVKRSELPAEVAALIRPPVERDRAGREGRRTLSGGQALIGRLLWAFMRDGGTVLTEHCMDELTVEGERVTGISAATHTGRVQLHARAGVIVAAGGFEHNEEWREQYQVVGASQWSMAPPGTNTGEPIAAGQAIGAAVDLMSEGWLSPGLAQPDGGGSFTLGFRSGIMVNQQGKRYANECLAYDRFGREMAQAADRVPSWFIFDSAEEGRLPAIAMPEGDRAEHLQAGTWIQADTIAELAQKLALPELEAEVERFNRFAASGVDEDFGRGADEYDTFFAFGPHSGPNAALAPLQTAPFYAAKFVLSDLGTKGGLVTDVAGRVLREDGSIIPGLYATSNSAASMAGARYPGPGIPLGTAMVFASLAVADLAAAPSP